MKDTAVLVRMTAEQKAEIAAAAERADMSVSQFVRTAALEKARKGEGK